MIRNRGRVCLFKRLVLAAFYCIACSQDGGRLPCPNPIEIFPKNVDRGVVTSVDIVGEDFIPKVFRTLDGDKEFKEDRGFLLSLVAENGATYGLIESTWKSEELIETNVPGSLPVGTYRLLVTSPHGLEGELYEALAVLGVGGAVPNTDTGVLGKDNTDSHGETEVDTFVDMSTESDVTVETGNVVDAGDQMATDSVDIGNTETVTQTATTTEVVGNPETDSAGEDTATEEDTETENNSNTPDSTDSSVGGGSDTAEPTDTRTGSDSDTGESTDTSTEVQSENHPPVARFTVSQGPGDLSTVFHFDGNGSWDIEDGDDGMTFDWDFEGDGIYDATGITASHQYTVEWAYWAVLRVTDSGGKMAYYWGAMLATPPETLITVNTPLDVVDDTDGLTSLSEAIQIANTMTGRAVISFSGPMIIETSPMLPVITSSDVIVGGGEGVIIDGASGRCFETAPESSAVRFSWLTVQNCPSSGFTLQGTDIDMTLCHVKDNQVGIAAKVEDLFIGPYVVIRNNGGDGLIYTGNTARIAESRFVDNLGDALKIADGSDEVTVLHNMFVRNLNGIVTEGDVNDFSVVHNTFVDHESTGLVASGKRHSIYNNIFVGTAEYGVVYSATAASQIDSNLYFNNGLNCSGCPNEPNALMIHPDFIDMANDDFRISAQSPCIDVGYLSGEDVNGPLPGIFNGAAPDIGAFEYFE